MNCLFTYYGIKSFKCELLSKEEFYVRAGEFNEDSQNFVSKKRVPSCSDASSLNIVRKPRRRLRACDSDAENEGSGQLPVLTEKTPENVIKSRSLSSQRSGNYYEKRNTQKSSRRNDSRKLTPNIITIASQVSESIPLASLNLADASPNISSPTISQAIKESSQGSDEINKVSEVGFSVSQMNKFANKRVFPKRVFTIAGFKKNYTPITHFYHCQTVFTDIPDKTELHMQSC